MRDLTITLVQANQIWEDKNANLAHYESLLKNANTDLILLPEMFSTGFSMNAEEFAEEMETSPSIKWLQKMAKNKSAAIYTSLIVRETGAYYNRGVFVYPDGQLITYDKRKTFGLAGEDKIYTSGQSNSVVDYLGWKIQLHICYDLRFPEIIRNRLLPNLSATYDVLLFVANWPEKRALHWKSLLQARAIENQSYVLAVNRVGKDPNGLEYSGDSCVVNMLGEQEMVPPFTENVYTTVIKMDKLKRTREMLPFLKDQ